MVKKGSESFYRKHSSIISRGTQDSVLFLNKYKCIKSKDLFLFAFLSVIIKLVLLYLIPSALGTAFTKTYIKTRHESISES